MGRIIMGYIGIVIFTIPSLSLASMQGEMSSYAQTVCNQARTRCLRINADRAESGELRPLFYLRGIRVTISDSTGKSNTVYKARSGFVDFEMNELVMNEGALGATHERVFNLEQVQSVVLGTK